MPVVFMASLFMTAIRLSASLSAAVYNRERLRMLRETADFARRAGDPGLAAWIDWIADSQRAWQRLRYTDPYDLLGDIAAVGIAGRGIKLGISLPRRIAQVAGVRVAISNWPEIVQSAARIFQAFDRGIPQGQVQAALEAKRKAEDLATSSVELTVEGIDFFGLLLQTYQDPSKLVSLEMGEFEIPLAGGTLRGPKVIGVAFPLVEKGARFLQTLGEFVGLIEPYIPKRRPLEPPRPSGPTANELWMRRRLDYPEPSELYEVIRRKRGPGRKAPYVPDIPGRLRPGGVPQAQVTPGDRAMGYTLRAGRGMRSLLDILEELKRKA